MLAWVINRRKIGQFAFVGLVVAILNVAAIQYLVITDNNEIDHVDLAYLNRKTVVVDPGHGGIDVGATKNGADEKDITLSIALKLSEIIQSHGGKVVLTRDSDIDYYTKGRGGKRNDLLKRIEIIDSNAADLFVSIHVNSYRGSAKLSGAQVFYSPNKPENKIVAEIMQRALANCPPGNRFKIKKDTSILILNKTKAIGVLVETGYISNPQEAAHLSEPGYQQKLAEQIAKGLAYHFSQTMGK